MMEKRERLHILSLGTSIIANLRNTPGFAEIPAPGPQLEDWLKQRRGDKQLREKAYGTLIADPYKLSAELNGMKEFLEKNEIDQVYLIATDTEAGEFCSGLLSRFFREKGIEVIGGSGPLLGYYKADRALGGPLGPEAASDKFADDLHCLFNKLVELLRKHKQKMGKEVYINATGGFKPEMAVLSLAGNLFLVPVYYIHETFKTTVFLPPLIPPEIFPEELKLLKMLYEKPDYRIVGKEFHDLYSNEATKRMIDRLVDFRVLEMPIHHEPDVGYEIKLTHQGKFWVEISQEMEARDECS